jgi:hypothetical protein
MAEGDGPAAWVNLGRVEAEFLDAAERLHGEDLINLDSIDLIEAPAGLGVNLANGSHRAKSHQGRIATNGGDFDEAQALGCEFIHGAFDHVKHLLAVFQCRGAAFDGERELLQATGFGGDQRRLRHGQHLADQAFALHSQIAAVVAHDFERDFACEVDVDHG